MITLTLVLTLTLCLISGLFDGLAETLKWHSDKFIDKFPRQNPNFWIPSLSWVNKWKNGDPSQGEKFWLSSRALVSLTDGYHLSRLLKNIQLFIAVALPVVFLSIPYYILLFALSYLLYTVGFSIIYDKLF